MLDFGKNPKKNGAGKVLDVLSGDTTNKTLVFRKI